MILSGRIWQKQMKKLDGNTIYIVQKIYKYLVIKKEIFIAGKGDHLSIYTENNPILQNRVRKLSMSVILNNDYDGGDFQFTNYNKEKCEFETLSGATGSVLVFPSDLEHRVKPITRGIRYSLVAWFLGPPFA